MSQALDTWKKKLEFLQQQEAILSDPAQKFMLTEQIAEAKAKIVELSGTGPNALPAHQSQPIVDLTSAQRELFALNLDKESSMEDIEAICYNLAIDLENITGKSKVAKARNLILYLERRKRIADLIAWGKKNRPELTWDLT